MKPDCASPSSISRKELARVAKLVRIKIADDEAEAYCKHLEAVITWFGMLAEVDTSGASAAAHGGVLGALPMREDAVAEGNIRDQIFANASEASMGFFVVKNVLE